MEPIQGQAVADALKRVCEAINEQTDYLTSLDQAMGDGDMGITLSKIAVALLAYADATPTDDISKFLVGAGMAANRAAPSTIGTLLATALMRMGKAAKAKNAFTLADMAELLSAADTGIQQAGKAKPGDKTIIDAIHPASEAFAAAVAGGASLQEAGLSALEAAKVGRDSVTALRSKVGRASWVGERTEGKIDPGCAAFVVMLSAIAEPAPA